MTDTITPIKVKPTKVGSKSYDLFSDNAYDFYADNETTKIDMNNEMVGNDLVSTADVKYQLKATFSEGNYDKIDYTAGTYLFELKQVKSETESVNQKYAWICVGKLKNDGSIDKDQVVARPATESEQHAGYTTVSMILDPSDFQDTDNHTSSAGTVSISGITINEVVNGKAYDITNSYYTGVNADGAVYGTYNKGLFDAQDTYTYTFKNFGAEGVTSELKINNKDMAVGPDGTDSQWVVKADEDVFAGTRLSEKAVSTYEDEVFALGTGKDTIKFDGAIGEDTVIKSTKEKIALDFDLTGKAGAVDTDVTPTAFTDAYVNGNDVVVDYKEYQQVDFYRDTVNYGTDEFKKVYTKDLIEYSSTKYTAQYTGEKVEATQAVFKKFTDLSVATAAETEGEHQGEYKVTAKVATYNYGETPAWGTASDTTVYITAEEKAALGSGSEFYQRNDADFIITGWNDSKLTNERYDVTTTTYEYKDASAQSAPEYDWKWTETKNTVAAASNESAHAAEYYMTLNGKVIDKKSDGSALIVNGNAPKDYFLRQAGTYEYKNTETDPTKTATWAWVKTSEGNDYTAVEAKPTTDDSKFVVTRTFHGETETIKDATKETEFVTDYDKIYVTKTSREFIYNGTNFDTEVDLNGDAADKALVDYVEKSADNKDSNVYTKVFTGAKSGEFIDSEEIVLEKDQPAPTSEQLADFGINYDKAAAEALGSATVSGLADSKESGVTLGSDDLATKQYELAEGVTKGSKLNDVATSTSANEKFELGESNTDYASGGTVLPNRYDEINFSGKIGKDEVVVTKGETVKLDFDLMNGNAYTEKSVSGNNAQVDYYEVESVNLSKVTKSYTGDLYNVYTKVSTSDSANVETTVYAGTQTIAEEAQFNKYTDVVVATSKDTEGDHKDLYKVTAKVATWDFSKETPAYGDATEKTFYVTESEKTTIGSNTTIYSRAGVLSATEVSDKAAVRYDLQAYNYTYQKTSSETEADKYEWVTTKNGDATQVADKSGEVAAAYTTTVGGHVIENRNSDTRYELSGTKPDSLYLRTVNTYSTKTSHANNWGTAVVTYEAVATKATNSTVIEKVDYKGEKTEITKAVETFVPTDADKKYYKETTVTSAYDGEKYVDGSSVDTYSEYTTLPTGTENYYATRKNWITGTETKIDFQASGAPSRSTIEKEYTGSDSALLGSVTVKDYYGKKFVGSVLIDNNVELGDTIYTEQIANSKGVVTGTDKNDEAYSTENPEKFNLKSGKDVIYFGYDTDDSNVSEIGNDEVTVNKNEKLDLVFKGAADSLTEKTTFVEKEVSKNDVIAKYYATTFYSYDKDVVSYAASAAEASYKKTTVKTTEAVFTRVGTTIAKDKSTVEGHTNEYAVTKQTYKYDYATSKWVADGTATVTYQAAQGTGAETFDTYKRGTATVTTPASDEALAELLTSQRYDVTTTESNWNKTDKKYVDGTPSVVASATAGNDGTVYTMTLGGQNIDSASDFNDKDKAKLLVQTVNTKFNGTAFAGDSTTTYSAIVPAEGTTYAGYTEYFGAETINGVTGDRESLGKGDVISDSDFGDGDNKTFVNKENEASELTSLGQVTIKNLAKGEISGAEVNVNGTDIFSTPFDATVDVDGNAKGTWLNEVFTSDNENPNTINLGSGTDVVTLKGVFGEDTIVTNKGENLSVALEANTYYNADDVVANGKNLEIAVYKKADVSYTLTKVSYAANVTDATKWDKTTTVSVWNGATYVVDEAQTDIEKGLDKNPPIADVYAQIFSIDGGEVARDEQASDFTKLTSPYQLTDEREALTYRGTVIFKDVVGKNTGAEIIFNGTKLDTLTQGIFSYAADDFNYKGALKGSALSETINAENYRSANAKGVNINSGSGNDVIKGSSYNDTIKANTLAGESATVTQTAGTNKVTFGKGNDTYQGSDYASSTVNAGAGDNKITTSSVGTNKITAKDGSNEVTISNGFNTVKLGNAKTTTSIEDDAYAHNEIKLNGGQNKVTSGKGIDKYTVSAGINTINSGAGADEFTITNGYNTIKTGAGDKEFTTISGGTNVITTGKGNDLFIISGGNNVIKSGAGHDAFVISNTNDLVYTAIDGGAGNDIYDVSAITDYSAMADDINITDAKGTNTLVLAAKDDIFFDVTVGKGTKFKDASGKTIKYTVGKQMSFINEGDLTVNNLLNDKIKSIEVTGKNAIKNVKVGASDYTLDVSEVAQNVASWLTANSYKSTSAALADLADNNDATKLGDLIAIYNNSASNYQDASAIV